MQSTIDSVTIEKMIDLCETMLDKAYCPYSNFQVASVLLTDCGKTFTGCNVENASYGLAICAERTAAVKAVSEGYQKFKACFVLTRSLSKIAPCGACRQFLSEMAKDVSNKLVSSSNSSHAPSSTTTDQQKVPPLRIVLNTAGNQKSSSTGATVAQTNQQTDLKRDGPQDAVKTGGKVRIKLGTNKQSTRGGGDSSTNEVAAKAEDGTKVKGAIEDNQPKEETTTNYSHLRRITRRSQRAVQTITNEDEESISSMTSTDENQNSTNSNSDNSNAQDASQVATTQSGNASTSTTTTSSVTTTTTTTTGSSSDTPRRYKRKKGETSESQFSSSEHDSLLNFQNYKLPNQNSFELFKNIRKQVDKKLRSLTSVQPKTPHGFQDYMLNRGAYLLDGNKLGNGTNLFMNEDGGLHSAPIGKYHALRYNRINYTVPNRAKVPLGLPINSPLYNLFIEQEKERYRMRMQHIKEREKLTLAAEQEIMRVYRQASMAAANQQEPFSACTMLKHQEIYNYMDSDGVTILANEDAQQEQEKKEGVRTRRRQHEHISPPPTRKPPIAPDTSDKEASGKEVSNKDTGKVTESTNTNGEATKVETSKPEVAMEVDEKTKGEEDSTTKKKEGEKPSKIKSDPENHVPKDEPKVKAETNKDDFAQEIKTTESLIDGNQTSESKLEPEGVAAEGSRDPSNVSDETQAETKDVQESAKDVPMDISTSTIPDENNSCKIDAEQKGETNQDGSGKSTKDCNKEKKQEDTKSHKSSPSDKTANEEDDGEQNGKNQANDTDTTGEKDAQVVSDDEKRAHNRGLFLSQLQDIDDKWDRIRGEMLIRHRNEAESLYAVQRLEWEWKTKEIGACDVRTTPVIDNILVPKLNIYSQDY